MSDAVQATLTDEDKYYLRKTKGWQLLFIISVIICHLWCLCHSGKASTKHPAKNTALTLSAAEDAPSEDEDDEEEEMEEAVEGNDANEEPNEMEKELLEFASQLTSVKDF